MRYLGVAASLRDYTLYLLHYGMTGKRNYWTNKIAEPSLGVPYFPTQHPPPPTQGLDQPLTALWRLRVIFFSRFPPLVLQSLHLSDCTVFVFVLLVVHFPLCLPPIQALLLHCTVHTPSTVSALNSISHHQIAMAASNSSQQSISY